MTSSHFDVLHDGDWIGEYEILQRLRTGGMATLFLGRRHGAAGFSRLAAIKVIHPHLSLDARFVQMFVDEARICSQISHPNVIHVEEFGEHRGFHYLVMEYLDGCSVNDALRILRKQRRRLHPELGARIIMQAAGGLHAAHEARGTDGKPLNIVHRDITPSNILLSTTGHIKVIDFGIARARGRLAETEVDYNLKGKLHYIAPEQARTEDVDRRADLFSLGVVFWELLVGEPLFSDKSEMALLERLRDSKISPPSEHNPDLPLDLDEIVLSMLAHNPEDRPATAWEVRRKIVSALPGSATREPQEFEELVAEVKAHRNQHESPSSSNPFSGIAGSPLSSPGTPSPGTPGVIRAKELADYQVEIESPKPPSSGLWKALKILAVLALVGGGVAIGLVMSGGDLDRAPPDPSAAPMEDEVAEPPAAESEPTPTPTSPRDDKPSVDDETLVDDEPSIDAALAEDSAGDQRTSKRPRRRRKRSRARRTIDKPKSDAATKDADRIRKGGVTIIDSFDDAPKSDRPKAERKRDTPIVTDFDD